MLPPVEDCGISNPSSSAPAVATDSNLPSSGESGSVPESTPNAPGGAGRPVRSRKLPARFRDLLPEIPISPGLDSGAANVSDSSEATPHSILPCVILHVFDSFRTSFNAFSIAREYRHRPSYDPNSFLMIDQLTNMAHNPSSNNVPSPDAFPPPPPPPPWPWKNMGIWRLMTWMLTGSGRKSKAEVTRLIHEVIRSEDFNRNHFIGFNTHTEMKYFDKSENAPGHESDSIYLSQDAWKESTVSISVPTRERHADGNGQDFAISGLFHCSLTGIICAVFAEKAAKWFHFTPFKRVWKSPSGQEQRVYDELYTSDAWITAHDKIQKQRRDDGCKLKRVIAGLMLWSDATHLAQFGTASAWPVYLFFGNQSKYA
jgi:hypothetical protein